MHRDINKDDLIKEVENLLDNAGQEIQILKDNNRNNLMGLLQKRFDNLFKTLDEFIKHPDNSDIKMSLNYCQLK